VVFGDCRYFDISQWQTIDETSELAEKSIYFYPVSEGTGPGDLSYHCVRVGVEMALAGKIDALVTAPISKEKWNRSGISFKGHTEYLAKSSNTEQYAMLFWSDRLKVCLFTIHVSLRSVFEYLDQRSMVRFFRFVSAEMERLFGRSFTLLVPGINPHAGEGGVLGSEERDMIIPAIEEVRGEVNIQGPFPPDIIFLKSLEMPDSVVVSWYHDQGLIPFKLLHLHSGVNVTLGLPYIRTSPDHGVAYDIAGKGEADPSSMISAIRLAERLVCDVG
jgi:4-hydroxythreonine-4-phosphate dehydrogenase